MPHVVPADPYGEHLSRRSVGNGDGPSRRRAVSVVGRRSRSDRAQPTSTRYVTAAVLAVVAATALHLDAQTRPPSLTFDAAFSMALRRNADRDSHRRQQVIWDAQHAGEVVVPYVSVRADDGCAPTCASAARSIEICVTGPGREALPTIGGSLADSDVATFGQIVRRNLRQAFDDLVLSDHDVQETQGLIDMTSQFRIVDRSDDAMEHPRLDALRVEIARSRAKIDLIRAEDRRRFAEAAFNAVLNRAPDVPVTIVGELTDPVPLPHVEPAIRLSKAMDVDLRQLRHDVEVQRRARAPSLPHPADQTLEETIVRLDAARVAREQALEGCMREGFARIETGRHMAHLKDTLVASALEIVMRTADHYRAGRADVRQLLDAQRTLVDRRREYLHVLRDLRLSEADVEERLPSPGIQI